MRKLSLMNRALLALALVALSMTAQEPRIPRKASDIGIQTGTDKYLWLSEQSGKTCVLAFILTTCPHCQFTVGLLNKIQKDYADKSVIVMASAIEPMSSLHLADFRKLMKPQFDVGYNEQSYVQKFLGRPDNDPMFMPQLAFVDRNGIIQAQYAGDDPALNKDIQEKSLRDALDKTLKAGAVRKPWPRSEATRPAAGFADH
ncbi:MAG: TlpA disulfide reductase family protein [Acidobacteriota bacterium]